MQGCGPDFQILIPSWSPFMTTHLSRISAIAAVLFAGFAGMASAADTQNLTVSASVQGVCRFSSAAQTLSFGTLNPATDGATTPGTGAAVTYRCTKGQVAAVTADSGLYDSGGPRMRHATVLTDFIPYTLTITDGTQTGTGFGAGEDKALGVAGSVSLTNYQNVSAGDYSDTVVLSITP
jgi:spore coat protein U-like protein